jgi:hypothetical protein
VLHTKLDNTSLIGCVVLFFVTNSFINELAFKFTVREQVIFCLFLIIILMKTLVLNSEDNYVEVEKLLYSKKIKFERRNGNSFIIPAISIAIVIELGFNLI